MPRRSLWSSFSTVLAILILAAGCTDAMPTAAVHEPGTVVLVDGQPSRVAQARHRAGTFSARITPAGGTLEFGAGTLEFPAGAVDRSVVVTARTNGTDVGVEFEPHGLVFNRGAEPTLTLNYAGVDRGAYVITYVEEGEAKEFVPTVLDLVRGTASGLLEHFSVYALMKT